MFLLIVLLVLSSLLASLGNIGFEDDKRSYYEILECRKDSTSSELKRSYHRLALEFHVCFPPHMPAQFIVVSLVEIPSSLTHPFLPVLVSLIKLH